MERRRNVTSNVPSRRTYCAEEKWTDAQRPPSEAQEGSLISEICGGRKEQFANLIQPHLAILRSVINRMVSDRFEADDLVQQTLTKAYLGLPSFRSDSSFRTWLISIAINEVGQYRRKRSHLPVIAKDIESVLSTVPGKECFVEDLERKELAKGVREIVAKLPRKYQVVIELQAFQGLSNADTARKLMLSVNGVKTRYLRARRQMALLIERQGGHMALKCWGGSR
jgi:RNA polymerase sigma-70 factor, ECF subfamily